MRLRAMVLAFVVAFSPALRAQNSVGQILSSEATVKGSVELAGGGTRVMSGSWVSAGDATALLTLDRGGSVRVCSHTSISVSTSASGRDLMMGMSTGAIEAHYSLPASADTILTPDFRILLPGPGTFHFAIGADPQGNTCVRPLANNTASLIVSELMGDGTYQVKPDEQVVFHNGRVDRLDHNAGACGCPVAPPPVMRAAAPPPPPAQTEPPPPRETPIPEVHVQIDAPFIYRAEDLAPSPLETAVHLHLAASNPVEITPLPPPAPELISRAKPKEVAVVKPQEPKKKFFSRVRSFFAAIFR
jgi:hypothetical protein